MSHYQQPDGRQKLVVIGNGMGSVRFLEQLFASGQCRFHVTVLSEEDCPGYNRIQLSKLLAGSVDLDGIQLKSAAWYQQQGIELLMGENYKAIRIDRSLKRVVTHGGDTFDYDRLVLATGSLPNQIPVPGADLQGVLSFRSLADVNLMLEAGQGQAVVIGGGLLGLECGSGLAKRGMSVTIVDNMPMPMARQLDEHAGGLLRKELEGRGIAFRSSATLQSYQGVDGRVCGVQIDGEYLPASLVVVTAGVRPNIQLMQEAGLTCDRGVLVNERLQTSDPDIFTVGECAQMQLTGGQEAQSLLFGLVAPVYRHAEIVAASLLGDHDQTFTPVPIPTNLKVDGINLFSSGEFIPSDSDQVMTLDASDAGIYRKLVLQNNRIKGVLLYGDVTDGLWYQELMESGTDISSIRQQLIFGQRFLAA
ncbi:NAD(P)/FAD-dependent oxidoreductase [Endozoicomonas acroporae]|uniref:NAD(P)/FAD-dependent oxidoreductase n=1 Tax=Endozoicomonas acroporae TaxID=1701104 RepID=UPI000C7926BC|nr:FAD-dependent oxidoreductase [Endozoicomonas acroporae]